MPDVDIRAFVIEKLEPFLPDSWRWYDYQTGLDQVTVPTVVLTLGEIKNLPEAPQGARLVSYTLTLIEPRQDPETRMDDLDNCVIDLLNAIDADPEISFDSAKPGLAGGGQYVGYDISISISIKKDAS